MRGAFKLGLGIGLLLLAMRAKGEPQPPKRTYTKGLVVGDSLSSRSWATGGQVQRMLTESGIPTERVYKSGKGTVYYIGEERRKPVRPAPLTVALRENPADLLVVILGANDHRLGLDAGDWRDYGLHRIGPIEPREAKYKAALRQFVDMARAEGVQHIIWLGPAKIEDAPDKERRAKRRAECAPDDEKCLKKNRMRRHGAWGNHGAVRVAEWQRETLAPLGVEWHDSQPMTQALVTRDGIHFGPEESKRWAAAAASVMSPTRA